MSAVGERDVARLALRLATLLGQATQRVRVVQLLRLAGALLLSPPQHVAAIVASEGAAAGAGEGDEADLSARLQPELGAVTRVLSQPGSALAHFCRGLALETLLSALLTVVAGDWLVLLSRDQERSLFYPFFEKAPAVVTLSAVIRHISEVRPNGSPGARGEPQQTYVTAVGSEVACTILRDRFASNDSTGVSELVEWCLWSQGEKRCLQSETGSASACAGSGPRLTMQGFMGSALMQDPASIAGLLVSMPDRLPARERKTSLEPDRYFATILVQAIAATQKVYDLLFPGEEPAGQWRHTSGEGERSCSSMSRNDSALASTRRHIHASILTNQKLLSDDERAQAGTQFVHVVAFVEALFQRCCLRGHARAVAYAVAQTCRTKSITRWLVLHCCDKVATAEKFVQQLLILISVRESPSISEQQGMLSAQGERVNSSQIPSLSDVEGTNEPATVQNGKRHDKEDTDFCNSRSSQSQPALQTMTAAFGPASKSMHASVHYVLCEKMLTSCTLPSSALMLLLDFISQSDSRERFASSQHNADLETLGSEQGARMNGLAEFRSLLGQVSYNVASVWGNAHTVHHLALAQQAYISSALENCLARLSQGYLDTVEGCRLTSEILKGVSLRLGSPLQAIRRQAMRIGRAFARNLNAKQPLFEDQGCLDLLPEEVWAGALSTADFENQASTNSAVDKAVDIRRKSVGQKEGNDWDDPDAPITTFGQQPDMDMRDKNDPDTGNDGPVSETDSDDDSLEPYDLAEDPEAEEWQATQHTLQLRRIAASLRKADDVTSVLNALNQVEPLIRAVPEELAACAPELCRALLHCRVPELALTEDPAPEKKPEVQRLNGLIALLACSPVESGDAVLAEVYSPHLDQYQRILILDTLCQAAKELSNPSHRPRLVINGLPRVIRSGDQSLEAQTSTDGEKSNDTSNVGFPSEDTSTIIRASKTRVWGHVSLRSKRNAEGRRSYQNLFGNVALRWACALLSECDQPKHGVDLFGRDSFLLGQLLLTLGTFVECANGSSNVTMLAMLTLEVLRSPEVCLHEEAYVRRSVAMTASQILANIPTPRLATALLNQLNDIENAKLLEQTEWVNQWAHERAAQDNDKQCRRLALACVNQYVQLSRGAMNHLSELSLPGQQVEIEIPRFSSLELAV